LKRLSNLIGFSLVSQQIASLIALITAACVYFFIQTVIFHLHPAFFDLIKDTAFLQIPDSILSNLLMCFFYASYMFIVFIIIVYFMKQHPFKIVPVRRFHNGMLIIPAGAAVLTLSVASDYVQQYIQYFLGFLHLTTTSPPFTSPGNVPAFLIYFFELCILAPFCEEFIFRGVILQNLRKFGNGFAVVLSALLFSLVHGNLVQMPLAFIMGLFFGFLVIEFNSIWVTIIMHFTVNTFSVLIDGSSKLFGENVADFIYLLVFFVSVLLTLLTILYARNRYNLKEKFRSYRQSLMPTPFLFKKYFLTPGTLLFTAFALLTIVTYLRILS
jgi:membrane protease YdiL (CAAX protease family)